MPFHTIVGLINRSRNLKYTLKCGARADWDLSVPGLTGAGGNPVDSVHPCHGDMNPIVRGLRSDALPSMAKELVASPDAYAVHPAIRLK